MTIYEIITGIAAILALVLSAIALILQRRQQKENLELQRATSELAKKQLEILAREDTEKNRAHIALELVKEDRNSYRFVITNVSNVAASNVDLTLLLDKPADSPLIDSERKMKLPAPKLSPGGSLTLIAALHMQSPLSYRAKLTWTNPDGSIADEETYVSL